MTQHCPQARRGTGAWSSDPAHLSVTRAGDEVNGEADEEHRSRGKLGVGWRKGIDHAVSLFNPFRYPKR